MQSSHYFWLRSTGFPIHHLTALGGFSELPACGAFEQRFRALQAVKATLFEAANAHSPQACRKLIRKLNEGLTLQIADLPQALREPLTAAVHDWNGLLEQTQRQTSNTRLIWNAPAKG